MSLRLTSLIPKLRIARQWARVKLADPNAVHTLSFFAILNAQEALVAHTNTRAGRRADTHTEFTTAPSVGADGSAAFVASAAWFSTFDLSSIGHSISSEVESEGARRSVGAGVQGDVHIVEVTKHSLDFDFGPKVGARSRVDGFDDLGHMAYCIFNCSD